MAKIRSIKPEFFRHPGLFELEQNTNLPIRVAFAGLWTVADREGRFRWQPKQIKLDILPYDDIDINLVLNELVTSSYLVRYEVESKEYGYIPTWKDHQRVRADEAQSVFPEPSPGNIKNSLENNKVLQKKTEKDLNRNESVTNPLQTHVVEMEVEMEVERKGDLSIARSDKKTDELFEIGIILNTGELYRPTATQVTEWEKLYPAVAVQQHLRNMAGWSQANLKKRKTKAGILRFVNAWLQREQDRGGHHATANRPGYGQQTAAEKGAAWLAAQRNESIRDEAA